MNFSIAIYDNDIDYTKHLMDYMKRKQKISFHVLIFTNIISLEEYIKSNVINILLINESISLEGINLSNIKNICYLSEGSMICEKGIHPIIYKFQSAELIMQELFSYYPLEMKSKQLNNSSNSKTMIYCIYSLAGDTYRKIITYCFAKHLAKTKKLLYINLNNFESIPDINEYGSNNDISDFIYYLKQNHPNLISKLNNISTEADCFNYIPGISFTPELNELTEEEMSHWIQLLYNNSDLDIILFDVGYMFRGVPALFHRCNLFLLIRGNNPFDMTSFQNFKDQLTRVGYSDILENITEITLTKEEQVSYLEYTNDDLLNPINQEKIADKIMRSIRDKDED